MARINEITTEAAVKELRRLAEAARAEANRQAAMADAYDNAASIADRAVPK